MMKKAVLIVLVILGFGWMNAQQFDLGKVTKEELEQKMYPKDSSAAAAILFNIGRTTFDYTEQDGFVISTEVKTKIKIYKKEGYEWANKWVAYQDDNHERVSFSDAATYNLFDGKVVRTKLKSEGEFVEKVNRFWSRRKIALPNIKEGCIIEYSYTVISPLIGTLSDWDFQESIPVAYSEYETVIPEYFIYNMRMKGFLQPKVSNTSRRRKMAISYMTKEIPGGHTEMPKRVTENIEFSESMNKYSLQDIPALKDESYVNNIANYTASVQHELTMTRYPNAPIKSYSTNWEDLVKTIYDADSFGGELKKNGYFEDDLKTLIAGMTDNAQKTVTIFDYVKTG